MPADSYLAGGVADDAAIARWIDAFDRDGVVVIENVLPPEWVSELKHDLDRALEGADGPERHTQMKIKLQTRMFEHSAANLRLFDVEPIVTFAETLIGRDDPPYGADGVHVMHNNSFMSLPDGGGITRWHQDDSTHYLVTHGEPPANVRLPVLFFTANYYLTDVTDHANGPTEFIPGSHLFGKRPPDSLDGTEWEDKVVACLGTAGSVVMFNNQVWHRGAPNRSDTVRYITQVSYARRIIGHMYFPFMNYVLPEHVLAGADERRRRLLGFLPSGAYG
jgi:hypothetical protein